MPYVFQERGSPALLSSPASPALSSAQLFRSTPQAQLFSPALQPSSSAQPLFLGYLSCPAYDMDFHNAISMPAPRLYATVQLQCCLCSVILIGSIYYHVRMIDRSRRKKARRRETKCSYYREKTCMSSKIVSESSNGGGRRMVYRGELSVQLYTNHPYLNDAPRTILLYITTSQSI